MKVDLTQKGSACALGFFDGVHLAHKGLIEQTVECAAANGLSPLVLTFKALPSKNQGKRLQTHQQRKLCLEELGAKAVFLEQRVCSMSALQFALQILKNTYNAKYIAVGFDYRFGCGREGDAALLKTMGAELGFEVCVKNEMLINGEAISSTRIKAALLEGDVECAARMLGRPYSYCGMVERGKGLAHRLGFATANLRLVQEVLVPRSGVYLTKTILDGVAVPSITSIGSAPTFPNEQPRMETHIIDFNANIYGKGITVEFLSMIRNEQTFQNANQLAEQIKNDVVAAKKMFDKYKNIC